LKGATTSNYFESLVAIAQAIKKDKQLRRIFRDINDDEINECFDILDKHNYFDSTKMKRPLGMKKLLKCLALRF